LFSRSKRISLSGCMQRFPLSLSLSLAPFNLAFLYLVLTVTLHTRSKPKRRSQYIRYGYDAASSTYLLVLMVHHILVAFSAHYARVSCAYQNSKRSIVFDSYESSVSLSSLNTICTRKLTSNRLTCSHV